MYVVYRDWGSSDEKKYSIFKKICSLNFIKISYIFPARYGIKLTESFKIYMSGLWI